MNVSFLTIKCVVPFKGKNLAELRQSCEIKKRTTVDLASRWPRVARFIIPDFGRDEGG